MNKKIVSIALTVILVVGLGNVVFANGVDPENNWSFEEMLPHMKKMHPVINEQQIKKIYKDCHGSTNENNKVVPMHNEI